MAQKLGRARRVKTATKASTAPSRHPVGREITWGDKLRYRIDLVFSRGTSMVILALVAATALVVVLAATGLALLRLEINDSRGYGEGMWQAMLRVLDPGTMGGDGGWPLRVVSLLVTLAGIFLASALIGLIAVALDQKIENLRKGRSFVVQQGHTLILGWSPRIFTIVSELVIANENQPGSCIVVLATEDKTVMEDEIRDRAGDPGHTRIVCRTGDPSSLNDLAMVNVGAARSIIVLGEGSAAGDAESVKSVLAVMSRDPELKQAAVVVELTDAGTAAALLAAGDGRVLPVRATDVVARVTAQACRQSGLSYVFQELLDFDGDEIYFQPAPELVGQTFAEALLAYPTSSVIGRFTADGAVEVNPPMGSLFADGDSVIAVSEDDDTVVFAGLVDRPAAAGPADDPVPAPPEHLLLVGWNDLAPLVLRQLDQFVAPGSIADVLIHAGSLGTTDPDVPELANLVVHVRHIDGRTDEYDDVAAARPYGSVIILGYREGTSPAEADAKTLLTLLLLNRALREIDRRPRIVTELLDARDVDLAVVTGADDFVVSDALASLMMAQLAERPELHAVFTDLFDSDGSAVQMGPARRYAPGGTATFAEIVAAASRRGEVALGYRVAATNDVVVNPPKSAAIALVDDDSIILIGPT